MDRQGEGVDLWWMVKFFKKQKEKEQQNQKFMYWPRRIVGKDLGFKLEEEEKDHEYHLQRGGKGQ